MYSERFREFSGLISRAEKALQRAKAENVRGYGLRGVHVSCLLTLLEQGRGLPASELAALCGVDRALVSRIASELMGLGLIREAAPGPRRRYRGALELTQEGRETAELLAASAPTALAELLGTRRPGMLRIGWGMERNRNGGSSIASTLRR